jgi:hypothetical protein
MRRLDPLQDVLRPRTAQTSGSVGAVGLCSRAVAGNTTAAPPAGSGICCELRHRLGLAIEPAEAHNKAVRRSGPLIPSASWLYAFSRGPDI